jgi:hypothetical protein
MSRRPWAINRQPDAAQDTSSPAMEGPGSPSQDERSPPEDAPKSTNKRSSEQSSAELRYPRKRSIRACHLCRARKTKCDNVQPTCGFCASIGANCSYDGKQHDHSSYSALTRLGRIESVLSHMLTTATALIQPASRSCVSSASSQMGRASSFVSFDRLPTSNRPLSSHQPRTV